MHWLVEDKPAGSSPFCVGSTTACTYVKIRLIRNQPAAGGGWYAISFPNASGQTSGAPTLVAVPSWQGFAFNGYDVKAFFGVVQYTLGTTPNPWSSATHVPQSTSSGSDRTYIAYGSSYGGAWVNPFSANPYMELYLPTGASRSPFALTLDSPVNLLFATSAALDTSACDNYNVGHHSSCACSPRCVLGLGSPSAQSSLTLDLVHDGSTTPPAPSPLSPLPSPPPAPLPPPTPSPWYPWHFAPIGDATCDHGVVATRAQCEAAASYATTQAGQTAGRRVVACTTIRSCNNNCG